MFRAENSNTNRHLCEFTGLDLEMEFKNHYFEVLDLIGELMVFMFKNMKTRYARELGVINDQYPFEDFKCADPVVKISFKDGIKLLHEAGVKQEPLEDLCIPRALASFLSTLQVGITMTRSSHGYFLLTN